MSDYSANVHTDCASQSAYTKRLDSADVVLAPEGGAREGGCPSGALTTAHISPCKAQLFVGASYLKVSKPIRGDGNKSGGKRGQPTFSKASRRRMMRELSKVRRDALPLFLGLTYPAEWPGKPTVWKRHLDNFWKRVVRRYPDAACIWKLEPQKRGAPHYHLLVWNVDYDDFFVWGRHAWHEIVESDDPHHLVHGFDLQEIQNIRHCFAYASKYIGKALEDADMDYWTNGGVGRFWGVRGNIESVMGAMAEIALTYPEAYKLLRLLRRAIHAKGRDYPSLTGVVDVNFWLGRLDELIA
jgi:hypothetical protein